MNTEIAGSNLLLNEVMIQLNVFGVSLKHRGLKGRYVAKMSQQMVRGLKVGTETHKVNGKSK